MIAMRKLILAALSSGLFASWLLAQAAQDKPKDASGAAVTAKPRFPGRLEKGFLLPNGWTVTPVGDQVIVKDLPLDIQPLADGKHALVATSGYNAHELSLIDLETKSVLAVVPVRQSWFGLAHDADTGRVWWSGGGNGMLHELKLEGSSLKREGESEPEKAKATQPRESAKLKGVDDAFRGPPSFKSGLAYDPASKILYSLDINGGTLSAIDASRSGNHIGLKTAEVGIRPYDVALTKNGARLYVSDWAGRCVLAVSPRDLRVVQKITVGEHPNQIAVHPLDGRIFVACASSNGVWVIDEARGIVTETILTALFPRSPEGSTPDAVAIAPDGKRLYVANADNNCIAVVDVSIPGQSEVIGFIPTGWYPTAVAVTPDGKRLLVGVGKGNQTKPNPISSDLAKAKADPEAKTEPGDAIKEQIARRKLPYPYIGTTLSGALSIIPVPTERELAAYTTQVYENCPYSDAQITEAPHPIKTAIPTKVGDPSPIKYVIYIIKENRTYDQVLGDLPRGNGDPSLVMFGREITPNHHKLAEEFVILDNLYCNGHVSADGHPWSTMAYNTDYLARNWALTYSRRAGVDLDDEGELAKAPSGFLWDACGRNNISYRSYGEYGRRVSQPDGTVKMEALVPGLIGHICPDYGLPKEPGKRVRDTDNAEVFLREFAEYEKNGDLPRFIVMSLGEDHTSGTTPGAYTPQACVASNDLALGRIVEAVSKSKYWPETAIFVIEDDAQNGPDHVDAHRTVGLLISPYVKRKHLDSTQYQTVSMIRTMELILGLHPLSQYDAAATPMFHSFTDKPNLAPYVHEPARIDLNATNSPLAYGAERSSKMDFSEYDKINDFELNEILWRAIKGIDAPLPPAVRRAIAYRGVELPPQGD
jgi:YVTN family beta-propeller protein